MSTINEISGSIRNDNLTINENFNNLNTDKLESGDLKTINGESIVGSGDLVVTSTVADGSITEAKLSTSVNNSLDLADTSVQPADISDFETTTQLNARDTANRNTDNHTNGTTNKVFTAVEQTKLSGIATGATANSSDATLLNRTNHTGTQTASTISDFDTEVSNNTDVASNTSARHSHSNKALLDTYTQTEADIADAISKEHTHSNKTILDNTTASFTTTDETKLDGIEAGAEVNTVTPTNTVALTNKDLSSGNTFPTFNQNTTGTSGGLTGTPSITVSTVTTTGNIELGNASDTTISRVSAGVVAIEGNNIITKNTNIQTIAIAISDETTAITTGTAKVTFRMPYAFTLTAVRASLTTVSSSGTPTFDINENGTTILSTKLTIDASEKTSTTAVTAPVISDSSLADDAEITIDIATAGTGATGAKIYLIGYKT